MADFIIIIRPEPDASRDVEWLRRYEVPAIAVPVMQSEVRPLTLVDATKFQAIIFTSRHAVAAVEDSAAIQSLRSLPVYAVGGGTALALRQAGFDRIATGYGGGSGLVPLVVADLRPDAGDLLWPSSTIISFDLAASLSGFGFTVKRIPVYSMLVTAHPGCDLSGILKASLSVAVVAMSARSIDLFSKMLIARKLDNYRHMITVIAGSKTIAEAAGSGWADILVAKVPRRSRLLSIATFMHRQKGLVSGYR